jgi:hypothetical protein
MWNTSEEMKKEGKDVFCVRFPTFRFTYITDLDINLVVKKIYCFKQELKLEEIVFFESEETELFTT